MADRFYTPDRLAVGEYILTGPEAHHLAAVRRFGPGDPVTLFNGGGSEHSAEVVAAAKKSVILNVTAEHSPERELGFALVVASALPKGDRADFLVEKLTELGATRFIPIVTERSVVRPKDAAVARFERAVIEASKQCGRNVLMAVDKPCSWDELLRGPANSSHIPSRRFLLHTDASRAVKPQPGTDAIVAVGPEGGFTPAEAAAAMDRGWQVLSLGPRVLRVETAAIAVTALLGSIFTL